MHDHGALVVQSTITLIVARLNSVVCSWPHLHAAAPHPGLVDREGRCVVARERHCGVDHREAQHLIRSPQVSQTAAAVSSGSGYEGTWPGFATKPARLMRRDS